MICYEDEFVVKVWMHGCGHVSGLIRTVDTRYLRGNPNNMTIVSTYISWWPGKDDYNKHSMPVGNFQKRTAQPKVSYFEDKFYETGYSAQVSFATNPGNFVPRPNQAVRPYDNGKQSLDVVLTKPANIVNIPGIGTKAYYAHQKSGTYRAPVYGPREREELAQGEPVFWGLNLVEMAIWWQKFLTNPKNGYQYASTDSNCAGVIMGALMAGGASAFVTIKSVYIYRTPENVRDVILALEIKLDKLNIQSLAFIKSVYGSDGGDIFHKMRSNVDLYSLKEFKEASKSKKFGFRREQVGKIDDNLSTYKDCGEWTRDNYIKKLTSLVNIMENVLSHRRDKPNSDRRIGVKELGIQVINLLTNEKSTLKVYLKRNNLAKENIGRWCEIANANLESRIQSNTQDQTIMKAKNR